MSFLPGGYDPMSAILGQVQGVGGLMNRGPSWLPQNAQFGQKPGFRGLLGDPNFALSLLANSGPSAQPRSFGQIFGQSALQANQMAQDQQDADFKRKYMEAQMGAMGAKQQGQPSSVQEYEYAKQNGYKGSYEDWTKMGGQTSRPSSVQEWEFYNALPAEQKPLYLEMKRNPNFSVNKIAGVETVTDPSRVGGVRTTPLSTLSNEVDAASALKRAESEAGAVGAGAGQLFVDIQKKGANAKSVMSSLDLADPLIDAATGSMSGAAADKFASTFGYAPEGAKAIASLKVLQTGLMLNMPRMEGPQSDADRLLYEQAAGSLGDPNVPREIKKAAVKTIRAIQQKYIDRASQPFSFPSPGQAPTQSPQNADPLGIRR